MVLGHSFNYMIAGLQEGSIYRDLLGKTVSPQVRETLRQSFSSGELRLEGQNTIGTVLISDIRNFTALAEKEEPTTILRWLNDYFGKLVPIVNAYGAIVDKFEGDAMLAFFGILPIRLPPEESAYRACQAAIEIMAVIDEMNLQRSALDVPPLLTGIGVNTGTLMAEVWAPQTASITPSLATRSTQPNACKILLARSARLLRLLVKIRLRLSAEGEANLFSSH